MRTILKVTFEGFTEVQDKQLPAGSVIRHVGEVRGLITMWFETDFGIMDRKDGEELETRRFVILGTGHPIPEGADYLATVPMASLVWHLFEVSV